ncbi:MAG: DEAD/DEAH box helicase [Clostridia bacterium]|nr:DEAD/DEAH box helicase [Clostridia bacterium]
MKFNELNLSEKILKALNDIGYSETTEIQQKSIPEVMNGQDIIGLSQTGTGKTAAFGIPAIENVDVANKKTQILILAPTRELACQITDELRKFTKYVENLKILSVYGGQSIEKQIIPLRRGVQIVVGTPGRIMDHMRKKTLKLKDVKMVILDEADEMLNMGFREDIETILQEVPEERQTLLFSATMNEKIMAITKKYLKNPKKIKIKAKELTVENIDQIAFQTKNNMKDEITTRVIDLYKPEKLIVFCNTKKKVDGLYDYLKLKKYNVDIIHGDIKQDQRDRTIKKFKKGDIKILIATDVAARGIDIANLDLVINYDIPQENEYYVHRIGRTGRNKNIGKAITFVVGKERNKLKEIEQYAKTKINYQNVPTITEINKAKDIELVNQIKNIIDKKEFIKSDIFDELISDKNIDLKELAKAMFTMINGQNTSETTESCEYEVDENGFVRLFFSLGKKDKIMVKDIIGSMSANTAISGKEIGKVNILDKFSFVDVPESYVEDILTGMNGKQIKGKNVNIEVANVSINF